MERDDEYLEGQTEDEQEEEILRDMCDEAEQDADPGPDAEATPAEPPKADASADHGEAPEVKDQKLHLQSRMILHGLILRTL